MPKPETTDIYEKALEDEEEQYPVDVKNIEKRWVKMDPSDQEDVINYLQVKEGFAWPHLTLDDKRAIYYIAYGSWGPRDQDEMTGPEMAFRGLSVGILFACAAFGVLNYQKDQAQVQELEKAADSANEISEFKAEQKTN